MRILVARSMPASSHQTEPDAALAVERFVHDRSGRSGPTRVQGGESPTDDLDVLLFEPGTLGERAIIVYGGMVCTLENDSGTDSLLAAEPAILAWLTAEQKRRAREAALERIVLFAELLARETRVTGVWDALSQQAATIARGWTALCFVRRDDDRLHLHASTPSAIHVDSLDTAALVRVFAPGLFTATSLSDEPGLRPLSVLFQNHGVCRIGCISVGGRGLLIVLERREQRVFEPDDWYRLRMMAGQADVTLERIEARDRSVASLETPQSRGTQPAR